MLAEETRPQLLLSQLQFPNRRLFVIVRTSSGDGTAVVPAIRRKLASLDRTLPMADVRTMDQVVSQTTTPANGASLILTGLGVSGLLLAALGVYAVTAYSVRQRTREIGIRIALGATRRQIRALIVRQGLKSTGVGLLLGAAGVFGLAKVLAALLGSLPAGTLVLLSAGPLLMAAVALLACIVPARAAASANPVLALREE